MQTPDIIPVTIMARSGLIIAALSVFGMMDMAVLGGQYVTAAAASASNHTR
jgi:hypothetical protein